MKALSCLCASIVATVISVSAAFAVNAPKVQIAGPADAIVKVSHHRRGDIFSNWCAYNCYRVSPCARGTCLGRYHYSHYAYDQDLPFPYRWDRDASPVDNVLAAPQYYIGAPLLSAGERRW